MVKNQPSKSSEFEENLEILRQMPFFSGLSLEALKVFAYLFVRETFKPGDFLFRQDDNDGKAFYIISGAAELVREGEEGESVLRNYEEGGFLGGLALLGDMRRLFSLKALTAITCLVMTRQKFMKAIEQFPELMPRVMGTTVERIRAWEEQFFRQHEQDGLCAACRDKMGVSLL
jgi:CRP-like cAMP-binding protein